jgi:hypothetical protein
LATDSSQFFNPENHKAARNSPIPPRALRSARLLGHGHVPTCQSLRLSAIRSRALACFAPLIQTHLHTLRSSSQPTSPSSSREPSILTCRARTSHTLNPGSKYAYFNPTPFPLSALPVPSSQSPHACTSPHNCHTIKYVGASKDLYVSTGITQCVDPHKSAMSLLRLGSTSVN